jgi:hypothetical protein
MKVRNCVKSQSCYPQCILHMSGERGLAFLMVLLLVFISPGMWIVSNVSRVVLPAYEGSMIIQNVQDYLCNDTVSCPKLNFLHWLGLKAAGCADKHKIYPPPPGMEPDCPVLHHHTSCELFYSYTICDWCSFITGIMLRAFLYNFKYNLLQNLTKF